MPLCLVCTFPESHLRNCLVYIYSVHMLVCTSQGRVTCFTGMLKFMSSRNVLTLLQGLRESYQMAAAFDSRPGLKFLIQKVAKADVASNLYKQAGISMTFYIHTLMEICAHQDNICMDSIKSMLYKGSQARQGLNNESEQPMQAEGSAKDAQNTYIERLELAKCDTGSMQKYMTVFVNLMHEVFNEVCTEYVDLYLDQEGPNAADKLSGQVLVFLLAQPEEICTLKREKSLKEMVAEKLKMRNKQNPQSPGEGKEPMSAFGDMFQATNIQGRVNTTSKNYCLIFMWYIMELIYES